MTPFSTMLLSATTALFEDVLDFRNPRLDQGQFVLGLLVFGVFLDAPRIVGLGDLGGSLRAARVLQVRQLFFELFHALRGEVLGVSVHR